MADTPPAVRHALSDLLEVLRKRREFLDSLRDWCADVDLRKAGPPSRCLVLALAPPLPFDFEGLLLEPENDVECVFEGEWERAAERCAKRLRIAGRPDLAEQVLAFVEEAPDLLAALDSGDLDRYSAEKEVERPVLERAIEQIAWLLENAEHLPPHPRVIERPKKKRQEPKGAKRPRLTKQEVQLRTRAAISYKIENPQADLAKCAGEAKLSESTLRGRPEWNEWLPKIERSAENGQIKKVTREWDQRLGEYVAYRAEDD